MKISRKNILRLGIAISIFILVITTIKGSNVVDYREPMTSQGDYMEREPATTNYDGNWIDQVDVVYYINLDHRPDRNEEFMKEMQLVGFPFRKIIRIPGVYKPGQGDWGCSLSHLRAMQTFHDSPYKNCIIFEDDFTFSQKPSYIHTVMSDFFAKSIPYDVCMLSGSTGHSEPTPYPFLSKVYDAQTASGYIVSKSFSDTLLKNYQEGSRLIEESYQRGKGDHIQGPYCIDQYWKRLQPVNNWYIFEPKLGKQRDSFSDIQGGFVKMVV